MEPGPGKHRKRTSQELAYDALIQFASTARLFYVQIAKAIHNPSRRREEVPGTPSMPMQAAAAVVSITMRDALTSARDMVGGPLSYLRCVCQFGLAVHCLLPCCSELYLEAAGGMVCASTWKRQTLLVVFISLPGKLEMNEVWSSHLPKRVHRLLLQWPGLYQALPDECVQRPLPTAQLANYITHMAGGLGNTLFDSRRRTCHSLVLNYFVAGNGLPILLEHFTLAIGLLRVTAGIQVPTHPDGKPGAHPSLHQHQRNGQSAAESSLPGKPVLKGLSRMVLPWTFFAECTDERLRCFRLASCVSLLRLSHLQPRDQCKPGRCNMLPPPCKAFIVSVA